MHLSPLQWAILAGLTVTTSTLHIDIPNDLAPRQDPCDVWGIWAPDGENCHSDDCSSGASFSTGGQSCSYITISTTATTGTTTITKISTAPPIINTIATSFGLSTGTLTGVSISSNSLSCHESGSSSSGPWSTPTPCVGGGCATMSSQVITSTSSSLTNPPFVPCPVCPDATPSDGQVPSGGSVLSQPTPPVAPPAQSTHTTTTPGQAPTSSHLTSANTNTNTMASSAHSTSKSVMGTEATPSSSESPSSPVTGFSGAARPLTAVLTVLALVVVQVVLQ